jgi:hypothetical protein
VHPGAESYEKIARFLEVDLANSGAKYVHQPPFDAVHASPEEATCGTESAQGRLGEWLPGYSGPTGRVSQLYQRQ